MSSQASLADSVQLKLLRRSEVNDETLTEMAELFEAAFGEWPGGGRSVDSRDHLRWKVASSSTDAVAFVGRVDGRLVTASTVVESALCLQGQREPYSQYCDTAVAPDMQGRGLARYMLEQQRVCPELRLHRALRIGEPQHPFIRRSITGRERELRLGNGVRTFYRVLDAKRCASEWRRRERPYAPLAAAGLKVAALWGRTYATIHQADDSPRCETAEGFGSQAEDLWRRAKGDFDLALERDHRWLNWRYGDSRGGGFTTWVARKDDRWLGYVVGCVREEVGYIADLLIDPASPEVTTSLLRRAVEGIASQGACGVCCWLAKRHPYTRALRRSGFLDLRDAGVTFRPQMRSLEALAFLQLPDARIHYTIGDTDLV